MATNASFDISTGADLQEVDNAVNQVLKEIATRYDFRGSIATVEFDRPKAEIRLNADDDFRMDQLVDVLNQKLLKRGVPTQNLKIGDKIFGTGTTVRCVATLTQGIPTDIAKKITKAIKDGGFKKVNAQIQDDEIRVSSPSKDELQGVMQFLRSEDFEIELKFGNFRG
jgi:uncharacterized protein YajQ (UPF0234 family)